MFERVDVTLVLLFLTSRFYEGDVWRTNRIGWVFMSFLIKNSPFW